MEAAKVIKKMFRFQFQFNLSLYNLFKLLEHLLKRNNLQKDEYLSIYIKILPF